MPGKEECNNSLKYVLDALYVLGGKWRLPLILCIMQSSKRFNEIQHELNGISPKILAQELKGLELNEFIKRNVLPTRPVTIIYEATAYSRSLKSVLRELTAWGRQHREKVRESMRRSSLKD